MIRLIGFNLGSEPALCSPGQPCLIVSDQHRTVLIEFKADGPQGRCGERAWVSCDALITPEVYNARLSRIQVEHGKWLLEMTRFLGFGRLAPGVRVVPARSVRETPLVVELSCEVPEPVLKNILAALAEKKSEEDA